MIEKLNVVSAKYFFYCNNIKFTADMLNTSARYSSYALPK